MAKPNTLSTANTFSHIIQTINDVINDYTSLSVLGSEFVRNDVEQTLTNDFNLQGQWEFQTPVDIYDYNGNVISVAGANAVEAHTGFQIDDPNSTGSQISFSVRNGNLIEVVYIAEDAAKFSGEVYANDTNKVWHDGNFTPSTKSDTGHTHTEADITDLDKYTQAEVDGQISSHASTTNGVHGIAAGESVLDTGDVEDSGGTVVESQNIGTAAREDTGTLGSQIPTNTDWENTYLAANGGTVPETNRTNNFGAEQNVNGSQVMHNGRITVSTSGPSGAASAKDLWLQV